MKSPAWIAQGWQLACGRRHAASPSLAIQPHSCKKKPQAPGWGRRRGALQPPGPQGTALGWGQPAPRQDTQPCAGFSTTHLLFHTHLGFLLQFCRLRLLLGLPHELLDEPPRDDRQEQGGGRWGWHPVLVPYLFAGAEAGLRNMA